LGLPTSSKDFLLTRLFCLKLEVGKVLSGPLKQETPGEPDWSKIRIAATNAKDLGNGQKNTKPPPTGGLANLSYG
jgi:hypothetical protein